MCLSITVKSAGLLLFRLDKAKRVLGQEPCMIANVCTYSWIVEAISQSHDFVCSQPLCSLDIHATQLVQTGVSSC